MSRLGIGIWIWVIFAGVSAKALSVHGGYLALWRLPFQSWGNFQLFLDLVLALNLALAWMMADAKRRQIPVAPFLVLTVFAGSFGPLSYWLVREWRRD